MLFRVACALLLVSACAAMSPPGQVHLSLTERDGEMRVMWVRADVAIADAPKDEGCVYGLTKEQMDKSIPASVHTYADGGFAGSIYNAIMDVEPDMSYSYQCGSKSLNSLTQIYTFRAAPLPMSEETVHVALFGDMGAAKPGWLLGRDSSHTQKMMNSEAENGAFNLIINVGDSSYANDAPLPNSHIYDDYFNQIEPTLARAPHMLCPGNHEREFDFAPYLNRTMMPIVSNGKLARFYNSWEFGPMHVVTFSTEHDVQVGSEQWTFVKDDLSKVNRTRTPWVIAFSHHAMYCADAILMRSRCGSEARVFREPMEPLFKEFGVDLYVAGHNHQYERSYPTYNNTRVADHYHRPTATTYIVNGAAGDVEGIEPWGFNPMDRSHAKGTLGFTSGFLKMHVNRTAMEFEYADAARKKTVDSFVMTRE